ncbi:MULTISPECIES: MarR family winged helix-turn-helix transcriptional regulator [Alphaproteobacteria]|uniref:MarR family transcriptional regulator n=2 Tax=Alphaproteobacteria TaxID=28211 RepID=A0A512HIY6_9HYPH|nr:MULTISPECIES: MarR family transcriptional regulator [Alphaproteobacteria]GEO85411.1 MarR family transcriptional regulator [Ciceribacter naphthalenivorans]GLR21567.1 MarR family transcriptional regulator [Ciceribacter naphthalenivorans]GLT04423.1 MarR family transcriptional regulator [Sphingomonas psychrolutea]
MAKKDKGDKKNKSSKKKESGSRSPSVAAAVTQASRAMRTHLSRGLADSGLYAGQDTVVQLLAEEDGLTPGALAHRLGVKAPTMTRTIGRMEAQGFVERRTVDADGRLTMVHLTAEGRARLEAIAQASAETELLATQGLSGKEVKQLVKLLAEVERNLHDQPEKS